MTTILKPISLVVLSIAVLPAVTTAQPDVVKKELETLKGDWTLVGREMDGKKSTDEEVKALLIQLAIKGDKLLFKSLGDVDWHEATLKLDPSANPKTLDVISTDTKEKKKDLLAIYKVEGDTFTVCNSLEKRPTQFTTEKGNNNVLLIFRRDKK